MHTQSPDTTDLNVRLISFWVHPPGFDTTSFSPTRPSVEIHAVFFNEKHFKLAKSFWQHTGAGISSRLADYCLAALEGAEALAGTSQDGAALIPSASLAFKKRYSLNATGLDVSVAKLTLRRRIADVLRHTENAESDSTTQAVVERKEGEVTEEEVYLFPAGMNAIWHAQRAILASFPPSKSVCFGYVGMHCRTPSL